MKLLASIFLPFTLAWCSPIAAMQDTQCNKHTDLYMVTEENCSSCAQRLLENKANPNAIDIFGRTPLQNAAWNNSFDVAKLLLQHNANPSAIDNYGNTPLHIAAWYNSFDVAKLLLQHKADPNDATNKYGDTPLHKAAQNN